MKIGGITYLTGPAHAISEHEHISADRRNLIFLQMMGFSKFGKFDVSPEQIMIKCIRATLHKGRVAAEDIDAVIWTSNGFFGLHDEACDHHFARVAKACGLEKAYPFGLTLSQCNGLQAALRLAKALYTSNEYSHILVIGGDQVLDEQFRFKNLAVNSDAVSCCVVGDIDTSVAEYILLDTTTSATLNDQDLVSSCDIQINSERQQEYLRNLKQLAEGARDSWSIAPEDAQTIICHNFSASAIKQICSACEFDIARVYTGNVSKYGHAFANDTLINLLAIREKGIANPGDHVTVISTGLSHFGLMLMEAM